MLVLSRKKDQTICIGNDVVIHLVEIRGERVRIGIQAVRELPVHRGEIRERMIADGDSVNSVNIADLMSRSRDAERSRRFISVANEYLQTEEVQEIWDRVDAELCGESTSE